MLKKNFTLTEAVVGTVFVLVALSSVALAGGLVYAAIHFIQRFW